MRGQTGFVTRDELLRDLRKLGVDRGDVIMLHVSVRAIGWVLGGPDEVIRALLDALGETGTLMMYVGWESSPYDLSGYQGDDRERALRAWPAYDPETSPSCRQWSILTEYLRCWPGAHRSAHPDSSFVAVGARAEWLTADHPLQYGMGPGSPLSKLCEVGGKVLLLGSPLERTTLLHHAEHLADVPGKKTVCYRAPVLREGQKVWIEIEEYDTEGALPWHGPGEYFFGALGRDALATGVGRAGRVGGAQSHLFGAPRLLRFAVSWIEERFGSPPAG